MARLFVKSVEDQLQEWRQAEKAACDIEAQVAQLGQGASDPHARDLYLEAKALRDRADRLFGTIMRTVKSDDLV